MGFSVNRLHHYNLHSINFTLMNFSNFLFKSPLFNYCSLYGRMISHFSCTLDSSCIYFLKNPGFFFLLFYAWLKNNNEQIWWIYKEIKLWYLLMRNLSHIFSSSLFKIFKKELYLPSPFVKSGDIFWPDFPEFHIFDNQGCVNRKD